MPFTIGDKVLIYRDHHDQNPREETIYAVKARYVVLMDGSRFTLDGREWGNSTSWLASYIEPATDEQRAEVEETRKARERQRRARRLEAACQRFVEQLSLDDLEWLYRELRSRGMPEVE